MVVPPIALMMVRHPAVNKFNLSSIQAVLTGAAPLGKELCDEFFAKFKNIRFLAQGISSSICTFNYFFSIRNDRMWNGLSFADVRKERQLRTGRVRGCHF